MRRNVLRLVPLGVLAVLALLAWRLGTHAWDRFRVADVVPDDVLRSSQPTPADLEELRDRRGVKSVINLRGRRASSHWYRDELQAARSLGLAHADVRIKLDDWPPRHEVRHFVELFDTMERPLLLHCKNGTDRSGWGATAAVLLTGASLDRALEQLSPDRGHICVPSSCYLHRFFASYERYLAAAGLSSDGSTFRHWAVDEYHPSLYHAELEIVERPEALELGPEAPLWFTVRARNLSPEPWVLGSGRTGVRLGARVIGPYTMTPEAPIDLLRTPNGPFLDLARAGMEDGRLEPGGERFFDLRFHAPKDPGLYVLQLDMVNEHVHWFSDLSGPGILLPLEVVPS